MVYSLELSPWSYQNSGDAEEGIIWIARAFSRGSQASPNGLITLVLTLVAHVILGKPSLII